MVALKRRQAKLINTMSKKLLREYVKSIIMSEDYGDGGYYGYNDGAYGPGDGMGGSGGEKLANAFKQSAKMIGGSIKAAGEDMSARAWTGLKVLQQSLLTTILPFVKEDYKQIFANEKNQLNQIRSKYAELFKQIDDAVFHEDFVFAAFLYNPAEVITTAIAKKAPGAAVDLLMILATGNEKLYNVLQNLKHDIKKAGGDKVTQTSDNKAGKKKSSKTAIAVGAGAGLEAINEKLRNLAKDRKVQEIISNNQTVASMKADGDASVKSVLADIVNAAEEDLHKARNIEAIEQNYPKVDFSALKKTPANERANIEHQLVSSVKKMIKDFHAQQIQSRMKRGSRLGFTSDSEFMQLHQKALDKLRSL